MADPNPFAQFHEEREENPFAQFHKKPVARAPQAPESNADIIARMLVSPFTTAEGLKGLLERAGKHTRGLMTGEVPPTPENVVPAAATVINPTAMAARGLAQAAGKAMPAFAEGGPATMLAAEQLAKVPVAGAPIRKATERAIGEFEEAAARAPLQPTGGIVPPTEGGLAVRRALEAERAAPPPSAAEPFAPTGGQPVKFMNRPREGFSTQETALPRPRTLAPAAEEAVEDLPWRVRALVRSNSPVQTENIPRHIVTMAGGGKGADLTALGHIRGRVSPEEWAKVQGSVLAELGRVEGGAGFSAGTMLQRYGELSPAGRGILFGSQKSGLRAHLDSLVEDAAKIEKLRDIPEKASKVRGLAIAGAALAEPISAISAVIGGRAVAKIMSRPESAAPLAQWSRAYIRIMEQGGTPAAVAAFKLATENLRNSTGEDIPADQLITAMQGQR